MDTAKSVAAWLGSGGAMVMGTMIMTMITSMIIIMDNNVMAMGMSMDMNINMIMGIVTATAATTMSKLRRKSINANMTINTKQ